VSCFRSKLKQHKNYRSPILSSATSADASSKKTDATTPVIVTAAPEKKEPLVIYKIQIAASEKNISLNDPAFAGIKDVSNDKSDRGMNRYIVGSYTELSECQTRLIQVKKKGFKDALLWLIKGANVFR
jgi:hypothetical protein